MPSRSPKPISVAEQRKRRSRVARLAKDFGFTGQVEYRHVYSQSGGAQYGRASEESKDLLTVYAEGFERDANPDDFSLAAIVAHERGHQLLARHPRIAKQVGSRISLASEEILASLLGAMLCPVGEDRDALIAKATVEVVNHGAAIQTATRRLRELWNLMETLL
ncbi:MAG: hypothetical protein H7062_07745 [Candidatus Saccharimonas sp.]|nr:hypothetical protein [Planctomycetaceae bacterium]